jgi:phosphoglycerol transferase MdoB-like AlkP superfamily enzyme
MAIRVLTAIRNMVVAIIAATVGSAALVAAVHLSHLTDERGRLLQERLPDFHAIVGFALIAVFASIIIGIPTTMFLKRSSRTSLRSFVVTGIIATVPLSLIMSALMIFAESDRPAVVVVHSYAAAIALAMSLPAYVVYWYAAQRSNQAR